MLFILTHGFQVIRKKFPHDSLLVVKIYVWFMKMKKIKMEYFIGFKFKYKYHSKSSKF